MSRSDFSKLNLSKFKESDHRQHAMKCIVACGIFLGFRSISEHLNLSPSDVMRGEYEEGHEFHGMKWVGVGSLVDKAQKLTVHQSYVRDTEDLMKIPVLPGNDPSCGASALWRMKEKAMPGQQRLYSYLDASTGKCFAKKPIGRNSLSNFHKEAATILGVDLGKFVGGHAWRRVHVSINANNRGLNIRDGMASSRHSSVSAYMSYVMPDASAEAMKVTGIMAATGNGRGERSLCDKKREEEEHCVSCGVAKYDEDDEDVKPSSTAERLEIEHKLMQNSGYYNRGRRRQHASDTPGRAKFTEPELQSKNSSTMSVVMERRLKYEEVVDARNGGVENDVKDEDENEDNDVPMSQTYCYSETGHEEAGAISGTQVEFDKLQRELMAEESEDEKSVFSSSVENREALGRQQNRSDSLVEEARALVRVRGVTSRVTSMTPRKRPAPSENEKKIWNLRMAVQQEKRLRRQERQQHAIDLRESQRKLEEYAERINTLEESFVFDHKYGNFYRP